VLAGGGAIEMALGQELRLEAKKISGVQQRPFEDVAKAYSQGIPKTQYWEYVYEDARDLIAKLPP
jgi:chaperonin GroEL (HSP60 family)